MTDAQYDGIISALNTISTRLNTTNSHLSDVKVNQSTASTNNQTNFLSVLSGISDVKANQVSAYNTYQTHFQTIITGMADLSIKLDSIDSSILTSYNGLLKRMTEFKDMNELQLDAIKEVLDDTLAEMKLEFDRALKELADSRETLRQRWVEHENLLHSLVHHTYLDYEKVQSVWEDTQLISDYHSYAEFEGASHPGYRLASRQDWDKLFNNTVKQVKGDEVIFTFESGVQVILPLMGYKTKSGSVFNTGHTFSSFVPHTGLSDEDIDVVVITKDSQFIDEGYNGRLFKVPYVLVKDYDHPQPE